VDSQRRHADRIVSVPSTDAAFASAVGDRLASAAVATETDLEDALRPLYPWATVRARELSSERLTTWYVYRDRDFRSTAADAWWEAPEVATAGVRAADAVIVAVDPAVAALLGRDIDAIVGRPITEFVDPDAIPMARAIWSLLLERGLVITAIALARPDGTRVVAEIRAMVRGDLVETRLRPVRQGVPV
jgi:PAS domain-containing protein